MDAVLGFFGHLLKRFAFSFVFFWIGWAILKCATLGRYPRTLDPRQPSCPDYELVSVLGILVVVGGLIFFASR